MGLGISTAPTQLVGDRSSSRQGSSESPAAGQAGDAVREGKLWSLGDFRNTFVAAGAAGSVFALVGGMDELNVRHAQLSSRRWDVQLAKLDAALAGPASAAAKGAALTAANEALEAAISRPARPWRSALTSGAFAAAVTALAGATITMGAKTVSMAVD